MEKIEEAMQAMPRAKFLPSDIRSFADLDAPLSIGFGQTNSQPFTLKRMLDWLDVKPGNKILDVGYGSGWSTALLSYLTGSKGKVIAVEKIPALVRFGKNNCKKMGVKNAQFNKAKNQLGWPETAPYDRILVSATADELPNELVDQLANGGRMVVPVQSSIFVIEKSRIGDVSTSKHSGYAFVPLVK